MIFWIGFIACTLLIVYSGTKLSHYGDILAEKTGLGRAWIGLVLIATVTSLPELITGITSVMVVGVPDIAAGDAIGSCVFNMLIISLLDAAYRREPICTKAHQGAVLSGSVGIVLLCFVALGLALGEDTFGSVGWVGPYSFLIIGFYFIAIRLVYFYEKRQHALYLAELVEEEPQYKDIPMKTAVTHYIFNALLVVIAATFLPAIGEGLAEMTGLGQTFVGNIFIALSTSLPEVVVSVAAVRLNAVDMAIGNLFGSNIFNMFIIAIDDLLFFEGPLLAHVGMDNLVPAVSAIAMTAIAIMGITYRSSRRTLFLAWDAIGIIIIYIINVTLLFRLH